jgi:hypothetical protein
MIADAFGLVGGQLHSIVVPTLAVMSGMPATYAAGGDFSRHFRAHNAGAPIQEKHDRTPRYLPEGHGVGSEKNRNVFLPSRSSLHGECEGGKH